MRKEKEERKEEKKNARHAAAPCSAKQGNLPGPTGTPKHTTFSAGHPVTMCVVEFTEKLLNLRHPLHPR